MKKKIKWWKILIIIKQLKVQLNLGIDFSKQEISEARLRNKLRLKKYEREKQEKEKKQENI